MGSRLRFDWLVGWLVSCELGSGCWVRLGVLMLLWSRISVASCVMRDVQSCSRKERAEWEGPSASGVGELGASVLGELET